jgi:hypothetical protein
VPRAKAMSTEAVAKDGGESQSSTLLHANQEDEGEWAVLEMKVRQVQVVTLSKYIHLIDISKILL